MKNQINRQGTENDFSWSIIKLCNHLFAVKDDKLYSSQRMKHNVSTDKIWFHINAEDEFNQCAFKTELNCNKIK